MTRSEIERRLQMHVLNLCLAATLVTKNDRGHITSSMELLVDEVAKIVGEAEDEAIRKHYGEPANG